MMHRVPLVICAVIVFPVALWSLDDDVVSPEDLAHSLVGHVAQLSEYAGHNLDDLSLRRTIVFGADNRPVLQKSFEDNGEIKSETQFTYDEQGNLTKIRGTGPDGRGNFRSSATRVYDSAGRLYQEKTVTGDQVPTSIVTYVYDEEGNWVRRQVTHGSFLLREIIYKQ